MASFKTHVSFGIAAGILMAIVLSGLVAAQAPGFLITILVVATLGSVLPDMDSDSSVPFHVAFGSLTIVVCALVFTHYYNIHPRDYKIIIGWTAGIGIFVWAIIGYIFRRFTNHRGIAHSIPAALLAGLFTFSIATRLYFVEAEAFTLALAMIMGFLVHLILDEVWAVVNFHGKLFVPNKAFGTSLKFFSRSKLVNLLVYSAIFLLVYGNFTKLSILTQDFLSSLKN